MAALVSHGLVGLIVGVPVLLMGGLELWVSWICRVCLGFLGDLQYQLRLPSRSPTHDLFFHDCTHGWLLLQGYT